MPTVHYISRETLRKHGIEPLQWVVMNSASTGSSNSSNKKQRVTTTNASVTNVTDEVIVDGSICINVTGTAADSGVHQPPYKLTGMDDNNIDAEDKSNIPSPSASSSSRLLDDIQPVPQNCPIIQQMDNFEEEECHEASKPKVDKVRQKQKDFFDHIDELKTYKEKHGHLKVRHEKDASLYDFCANVRRSRRAIITGKGKIYNRLDDGRIAALDAVGFEWEMGAGATRTKDDSFIFRVEELKAHKEKHGHLNIRKKENRSLYDFCRHMREARRAIISGKGSHRKLTEDRIAALDAIGFNWNPQGLNMSSTLPFSVTSTSTIQATTPKINIGDVGYQYRKEFDSGWFNGKVVEIRPNAVGGRDRRCVYEDGDCEDLTFNELKRLATLLPQKHGNV
jgi:hypothetical protein